METFYFLLQHCLVRHENFPSVALAITSILIVTIFALLGTNIVLQRRFFAFVARVPRSTLCFLFSLPLFSVLLLPSCRRHKNEKNTFSSENPSLLVLFIEGRIMRLDVFAVTAGMCFDISRRVEFQSAKITSASDVVSRD